ncbi:hypothetical protein Pmani_031521 [Petrolisthes manimaculis]|uniref:Bis(5'-nucleosyl)-tetraphosphatase [asymmetrical] n=1 Tax=Petrolisthes manimaculis TaxID=1843537 RepID=A0AAE1NV70_9EUCA|nr:hypothetical protein Pmani_031521 [Petrolisthes manimaculis]
MSGATKVAVQAAGLILFRRVNAEILYLMLQCSREETLWTPPKGHVDPGETLMEAAVREIKEEAGFEPHHYTIVDRFQEELKYTAFNKSKSVVFWAAEVLPNAPEVKLSHEHMTFRWCPLAEACTLGRYPEMVGALKKCEEFLCS